MDYDSLADTSPASKKQNCSESGRNDVSMHERISVKTNEFLAIITISCAYSRQGKEESGLADEIEENGQR